MIHLVYEITVPVSDGTIARQAYHVEADYEENLMTFLDDRRISSALAYPTSELAEEVKDTLNSIYKRGGMLFDDLDE